MRSVAESGQASLGDWPVWPFGSPGADEGTEEAWCRFGPGDAQYSDDINRHLAIQSAGWHEPAPSCLGRTGGSPPAAGLADPFLAYQTTASTGS